MIFESKSNFKKPLELKAYSFVDGLIVEKVKTPERKVKLQEEPGEEGFASRLVSSLIKELFISLKDKLIDLMKFMTK
jgi:hypothetical protein